jgi:transcriptional regulator with XRE-family HTH domain
LSSGAHTSIGGANEISTLGERLRSRRKALRLTLAEVSRRAGISEGFLSQIERGLNTAGIATLQRLCQVLEIAVGDLFADQERYRIHRHERAIYRDFGVGGKKVRITPSNNSMLESFIGELEPYGSTGAEAYSHGDSEELLVVLRGKVRAQVDTETHVLSMFDSLAYRSSSPHRVEEIDGEAAVVLWVMSPPSY